MMQDDFYTNNHSNSLFDNPSAMHKTTSLLIFLTFIYSILWAVIYIVNLPYFAINKINLYTKGIEVNLNIIQENLSKEQYSFFSPSLDKMRLNFEILPSVRSAQILRQYPNQVDVILEKQQAFALWGNTEDNLYINHEGEVYSGGSYDEARVSITLEGKTEDAKYILQQYHKLQKLLTNKIVYLKYSNENNWIIKLAGEIYLTLGRDELEILAKKIKFWQTTWNKLKIKPEYTQVNHFDLRYDGFAFKLPNANINSNLNPQNNISIASNSNESFETLTDD